MMIQKRRIDRAAECREAQARCHAERIGCELLRLLKPCEILGPPKREEDRLVLPIFLTEPDVAQS